VDFLTASQVSADPRLVEQRRETREEWRGEHDFWYRVILTLDGFPRGYFVEIVLADEDSDCPTVSLVNSHPPRVN
jgi:hypothetical protein